MDNLSLILPWLEKNRKYTLLYGYKYYQFSPQYELNHITACKGHLGQQSKIYNANAKIWNPKKCHELVHTLCFGLQTILYSENDIVKSCSNEWGKCCTIMSEFGHNSTMAGLFFDFAYLKCLKVLCSDISYSID